MPTDRPPHRPSLFGPLLLRGGGAYVWQGILCVAAFLYLALWPRHYVGFYNDDAVYVLDAKSLLGGHYVALNLPGHPPVNLYPPGFPLLLAPFVKLFEPHWAALKVVPFGLTLFSCLMLWRLSEGWMEFPLRLALLLLYAFNPMTASFAGFVMSEPCFVFALLLTFSLLRRSFVSERHADAWGLGLVVGWSLLIRMEAAVLLLSVALALIFLRRWRTLKIAGLVAIFPEALYFLRNLILTHSPTTYVKGWEATLPYLTGQADAYRHLFLHIASIGGTLMTQNVLAMSFAPMAATRAWALGLSGLLLIFFFIGVRTFIRQARYSPGGEAWLLSVSVFCFLYLWIHCLWLSVEIRYMIPLVPFVLAACLQGFQAAGRRVHISKGGVLGCALMGMLYLRQDAIAVYAAWQSEGGFFPKNTFAWIRSHVPQEETLLALEPAVVTLYTGRYAAIDVPARDREEFLYRLLERKIHYVLLRPAQFYSIAIPFQDPNHLWDLRRDWISASPQVYRLIYSNPEEARQLFAVVEPPAFRSAYQTYAASFEDFQNGRWEAGFSKLDQASKIDPTLISAFNGYAVGCLLSGQHLERGMQKLQQALALRPDYPLALLNLARLYHKRGRDQASRIYYAKAAKAIQETQEYERLAGVIKEEQQF